MSVPRRAKRRLGMNDRPQQSLRQRLLRHLLWPLLALLLISVMVDYRVAYTPTEDAYDHDLRDDAAVLAAKVQVAEEGVQVDLSEATAAAIFSDSQDHEYIAVWGPDGRLLAGNPALGPAMPKHGLSNPYLDDDVIDGKPVRKAVFHMNTLKGAVTVIIAETTNKRQRAGMNILLALMAPNLLLILAALGLVYGGVTRALRPLVAVSQAIAARDPSDLGPLPSRDVPAELAPVVQAMSQFIERLRTNAQSQQDLFANAAHQLKTPLAGLQTQLELAIAESGESERPRMLALLSVSQRIAHLTHQLLALARSGPEADVSNETVELDLMTLIEEGASDWYSRALSRDCELIFELSPCRVIGSAWLIKELLANLIENAIAYGPEGGDIWVRCGEDGTGHAVVDVMDSGMGIQRSEQEKVFQRFYRSPSACGDGAGLGLAIVKEIADRHRATVGFVHAEQEAGFCVRVTFPQAQAKKNSAA